MSLASPQDATTGRTVATRDANRQADHLILAGLSLGQIEAFDDPDFGAQEGVVRRDGVVVKPANAEVVDAHGLDAAVNQELGTLDKFIGDGVMAFWGAPAQLDDHAYHSCVAALRIQRGMVDLNAQWAKEGLAPLHVRVGIHSDAVLVGNIGSLERMSYTVMGDGVNLAARLEGTNKEFGTRICISHAVYREAGERLWLRRMGVVTVKGRRADLQVYELMGIKGGDPDLEASATTQQLCELTDQAYAAYEGGYLEEAAQRFDQIIVRFPQDRLARVMAERCRSEVTA